LPDPGGEVRLGRTDRRKETDVGLFRKRSQAEKDLEAACFSIGTAFARSALGEMPGDFFEAVLTGDPNRVRRLYAEVVSSSGAKAADDASVRAARNVARDYFRARNASPGSSLDSLETSVRQMLAGP
jgi:hypothetical protein